MESVLPTIPIKGLSGPDRIGSLQVKFPKRTSKRRKSEIGSDRWQHCVNLKSFAIRPLTESICEFIIRAQIQLYFFEITIVERHAPIHRFVDMIQADCLRNLKEFGIAHFGHYKKVTEQYWFRVFDTFTSTLSLVEQLQLNTPLHLEWCQYVKSEDIKLARHD